MPKRAGIVEELETRFSEMEEAIGARIMAWAGENVSQLSPARRLRLESALGFPREA